MELAKRMLAHVENGTTDQTDDLMEVPVSEYVDPDRWAAEMEVIFKRVPLALALTCELREPGAYKAIDVLVPGGRCAVLAYHSGEDRIVKARFNEAATGGCICPPGLPCVCGAVPRARLVWRGAHRPGPAELAANPRSESARLRAAEKLEIPT